MIFEGGKNLLRNIFSNSSHDAIDILGNFIIHLVAFTFNEKENSRTLIDFWEIFSFEKGVDSLANLWRFSIGLSFSKPLNNLSSLMSCNIAFVMTNVTPLCTGG